MPIAARKLSGAERKRGKVRIRSSKSSGIPWIVDAVSGEGRIGLDGFVSELNVLIRDKASGIGAAFALCTNVVPPAPLWRRIVKCYPVRKGFNFLQSVMVDRESIESSITSLTVHTSSSSLRTSNMELGVVLRAHFRWPIPSIDQSILQRFSN